MQTGLSTWDELVQAISIGLGIVFSCIFFNPVSLSHLQHLYIAYASYMSSLSIFLRLALGNNLLDILAAAFEYRSRLNRRVDGFSWSENLSASLTLEAASFYSREESWASSLLAKQSETIKYHPFVSRVVFMYIEK